MPAIAAAQPQLAVRQASALEECVELDPNKARQLGARVDVGVRYEAGRMQLHLQVSGRLLQVVEFVSNRRARSRRPASP